MIGEQWFSCSSRYFVYALRGTTRLRLVMGRALEPQVITTASPEFGAAHRVASIASNIREKYSLNFDIICISSALTEGTLYRTERS